MKRNWLALPLICGLLLTLAACGGVPATNDAPGADSDLAYVTDKGTLVVACRGCLSP